MKWYVTSINGEVFRVLATDCESALHSARKLYDDLHGTSDSENC